MMRNEILQNFKTAFGFDDETALELLEEFVSMVDRFVEDSAQAMRDKNFILLSRTGHTLKGCAANAGFQTMVDAALLLETSAKSQDSVACQQAVESIKSLRESLNG